MRHYRIEPFIEVFLTPDEAIVLDDAVACYLGYLQHIPSLDEIYTETAPLLERFQRRLSACTRVTRSSEQEGEEEP